MENIKVERGILELLLMYVGNLEEYQGIDLMLQSFALALQTTQRADLAIIGGTAPDIQKYESRSRQLEIDSKVHFLGPRPVEDLGWHLAQADILISPRIKGENTPMKLYSYLHSGKAVLASNLPTHTQLIDGSVAFLVEPKVESFADAMIRLIDDEKLRSELGRAGKELVEQKFTYRVYREKLNHLFDSLESELRLSGNGTGPKPRSAKINA